MKRGEMLNKIQEIVHEYRRNTIGVTSDELGEMILTMIEREGMLPPEYIGESGNAVVPERPLNEGHIDCYCQMCRMDRGTFND